MSLGVQIAVRWFSQQMERLLMPSGRRWDREANTDLLADLKAKVADLEMALDIGLNVKEAAVEVGSLAMMLAFNAEKGIGDGPSEKGGASPSKVRPSDPAAVLSASGGAEGEEGDEPPRLEGPIASEPVAARSVAPGNGNAKRGPGRPRKSQ